MLTFLDVTPPYPESKFVVFPVPYEATTTYGKGTKNGPKAILLASKQVEWFDEELGCEPCQRTGIHTGKPTSLGRLSSNPSTSLGTRVQSILGEGKVPVILGGEHSITPQAVKAFSKQYKDLSVLQLDAHGDLWDKFNGNKNNHACVMRRVLEICPAVQVGIRNISKEGWGFAKKTGQLSKIHFRGHGLGGRDYRKIEKQLSNNVYITIDVDVFDPSVVPAVGTPEPGGMTWFEVLDLLKSVCKNKNVVGFDVVELSPRKGDIASDFTVAKLIYKIIGYLSK
ncbi:MAG: agmatinase [Candidatus Saganbacteria bacterium]|nr:agmatinase [Candidatus Saganbacteria bacterium]